jgi:5'(3')-deoxyribonucleotidase
MKRIAIDMDEVTADTMAHYLNLYNAEFNRKLTKEHLYGKRLAEVLDPAHIPRASEYSRTASFFAGIPVMADSRKVIRELMRRYEIFITTAAMDVPCSFTAKFDWLQKHFPFIPTSHVVFCGDKSIVAADYLIDDDTRHFERFRGEGILFTAPHNVNETAFRRVNDWVELGELFLNGT